MMASLGGYVQKMIILLVALFVAGSIPGVHRMSLAVGLLVTLIGVTAAEGWAGYRFRTAAVDPAEAGTGSRHQRIHDRIVAFAGPPGGPVRGVGRPGTAAPRHCP
jgi:hypothetical protein